MAMLKLKSLRRMIMSDIYYSYELNENEIEDVGGAGLVAIIAAGAAIYGAYKFGEAVGRRIP
jgi:predicted RNA methylase